MYHKSAYAQWRFHAAGYCIIILFMFRCKKRVYVCEMLQQQDAAAMFCSSRVAQLTCQGLPCLFDVLNSWDMPLLLLQCGGLLGW